MTTSSLQRAKGAPLGIYVNIDDLREAPWFPKMIDLYVGNTKIIYFSNAIEIQGLKRVIPGFPQSTPNLRSLTVESDGVDGCPKRHTIDPFESLAPTLGYLKLVEFPFCPSFLRLRPLTELEIRTDLDFHLDTLLDFLEENRLLKRATLHTNFTKDSLRSSQRATPIVNQLQYLSIGRVGAEEAGALISNIELQIGAHLEIVEAPLNDILSGITATRLVGLLGPSGGFSHRASDPQSSVTVFPALPLVNVREFHLINGWRARRKLNPSLFPVLETFVVVGEIPVSRVLSTVFSKPSFPPRLKTLAFVGCNLNEDFMGKLTRFASNRKDITWARLHRVVIIDSRAKLPSAESIDTLEKLVPVVDIRVGKEVPTGLT